MRACSVILPRDFLTTSLNLRVCLINYSWTVNKFQSFLIDWSRLLKKSSNSSLKLSLIKIMWFRRATLCFLSDAEIDWFSIGSLSSISFKEVSISCFKLFWKSNWSSEPRGTTGWSKWVECRQRAQMFSESFRHSKMTSSPWTLQILGGLYLAGAFWLCCWLICYAEA